MIRIDATIYDEYGTMMILPNQEITVGQAANLLAEWIDAGHGDSDGAALIRGHLAAALGFRAVNACG